MARPSAIILMAAALALPALAQDDAPARTPEELERLRGEIADTDRQRQADAAESARLAEELAAYQAEATKIAADVQRLERELTLTERRVVELGERETTLSSSLDARRDRIGPLLGALQRLRRDPPPALAVSPGDAIGAARGAMMIADIAKRLEIEARQLAAELTEIGRTRAALATERQNALARSDEIAVRRDELAALIERRQASISDLDAGVAEAATRIAGLEARTADMADLMAWVEDETARGAAAPAAEAASGPVTVASRAMRRSRFTEAKGTLAWPAAGLLAGRFGEADTTGAPAKGVTLRTRADAQVTAPVDGEIVFAGPFGGYGDLLILAPAEDYFILIGGLGRLDVLGGQHVLTGEPLGAVGAKSGGEALMYIELRRNGAPIDPLGWFIPVEASG